MVLSQPPLVLLATGKKLRNYLLHFSIILTNTMKILELNVFEKNPKLFMKPNIYCF